MIEEKGIPKDVEIALRKLWRDNYAEFPCEFDLCVFYDAYMLGKKHAKIKNKGEKNE